MIIFVALVRLLQLPRGVGAGVGVGIGWEGQ